RPSVTAAGNAGPPGRPLPPPSAGSTKHRHPDQPRVRDEPMNHRKNGFGTRVRQIGTGLAGVVLVSALAAACSSSSSSSATAGAGAAGGGGGAATSSCGTAVAVGPKNPSGVYSTLSPGLKKIYTSYPDNL